MVTFVACLIVGSMPTNLNLAVAPKDKVTIQVSSTGAEAASSELLGTLNEEAKKWADRFVKVHQSEWSKTVGESFDVRAVIRMPLDSVQNLKGRDVQFRKGDFLSGNVELVGDNGTVRAIPFNLRWTDGEWTHDARYRKSTPTDVVLKAYVRKAVDRGFELLMKGGSAK